MASKFEQIVYHDRSVWDPDASDVIDISASAAIRIKNDLSSIYKDPLHGIFVYPDAKRISRIHALIVGPSGTPYEGGFFKFIFGFTSDYPLKPPKVKCETTGFGTGRLNPNLYKNGKVCLSILGTTNGPGWSPAQNLSSILLSIQSRLNDKPLFNVTIHSKDNVQSLSDKYNIFVQHETLRCAVCDIMDRDSNLGEDFKAITESSFPDYYQFYVDTCTKYAHLDGSTMTNPFERERSVFQFVELRTRLEAISEMLGKQYGFEEKKKDCVTDIE